MTWAEPPLPWHLAAGAADIGGTPSGLETGAWKRRYRRACAVG
ncbi:hypothetical protein ACRJ4W_18325 [Streptomyces sp. GLT-R25]